MKKAGIRDLRYDFSRIDRMLTAGEEIEISRRGRVIARLTPVGRGPRIRRPDFRAMLRKIYGAKTLRTSGAELLARERARY